MRLLIAVLLVLSFPVGAGAQTEVFPGITTEQADLIPLAISPFIALDGTRTDNAVALEQLISSDLEFSGIFKIVRGSVPLAGNGNEGLVEIRGTLALHQGETHFEGRVIDAASDRPIGGKRYLVKKNQIRQIAHHFADEVVRMLTGETGIASTKILFRRKGEGTWEVVLSDYDGYNPKVLIRQSVPILFPRWVDHSRALAYTSFRHGKPDLYLRYLKEPSSKRIVSFEGVNYSVDWSEKRKELVATLSKDGNAELYILDKSGRVQRRLTHNRAIDCSPNWSPTGREILFTSDRSGNPQVFIMESGGGNVRRLSFVGSYNESPAWSPKGNLIVYVSRIDGFFQLCTIRPDGTGYRPLTWEAVNHEEPRWAPSGRHIVFTEERGGERLISIIDIVTNGKRILSQGENPDWSFQ